MSITSDEMAMLQSIRHKTDELARLLQDANAKGFTITFNINPALGACDQFQVFKMMPVDLRSAAN
jgi:hypothetical protein